MSTSIDLGSMEPLVAKAILDALTDEVREKLIADAIKHLITPTREQYSSRPPVSPIQQHFDSALATVARRIAEEVIANDPRFADAVRNSVVSFIDGLSENQWDTTLVEAAVLAIVEKLRKRSD